MKLQMKQGKTMNGGTRLRHTVLRGIATELFECAEPCRWMQRLLVPLLTEAVACLAGNHRKCIM